jgi:hypothetical protein
MRTKATYGSQQMLKSKHHGETWAIRLRHLNENSLMQTALKRVLTQPKGPSDTAFSPYIGGVTSCLAISLRSHSYRLVLSQWEDDGTVCLLVAAPASS